MLSFKNFGNFYTDSETAGAEIPVTSSGKDYFLMHFLQNMSELDENTFRPIWNAEPDNFFRLENFELGQAARKYNIPDSWFETAENDEYLDYGAYGLSMRLDKAAREAGFDMSVVGTFVNNNSEVVNGIVYRIVIDGTYEAYFPVLQGNHPSGADCGPYAVVASGGNLLLFTDSVPDHNPIIDVWVLANIVKQPKTALEYYIAKAAGYPILSNILNDPTEARTPEERYWQAILKTGPGSDETPELDTPGSPPPQEVQN